MSIRITGKGLDAMSDALRDIQTKGIPSAQRELDDALSVTMETSRALAHVSHDERHSGRLKASGEHHSEHGETHWSGAITYGDRGAGYELQRGGDHAAFIDALAALSEGDFERAMDSPFLHL